MFPYCRIAIVDNSRFDCFQKIQKNEIGYSTNNYWKRTVKDIYRIESTILKISKRLREIRS